MSEPKPLRPVEISMTWPSRNALGEETMRALLAKIRAADGAPLLLSGTDKAFCAGLDLREVAALDGHTVEPFLRLLEALMTTLYLYPGPTVACVEGHAIAGGCILALCCDVRVATTRPDVRFGLNEVALGLRFPPRVFHIARRRVPVACHEEVLLGAELFDPAGALSVGLVDVIDERPREIAEARLARLAALPPEAYEATKLDLRARDVEVTAEEEGHFYRDAISVWTSRALRARIAGMLKK
jgi:enoyl-CoA hydratase/carnithine racemase